MDKTQEKIINSFDLGKRIPNYNKSHEKYFKKNMVSGAIIFVIFAVILFYVITQTTEQDITDRNFIIGFLAVFAFVGLYASIMHAFALKIIGDRQRRLSAAYKEKNYDLAYSILEEDDKGFFTRIIWGYKVNLEKQKLLINYFHFKSEARTRVILYKLGTRAYSDKTIKTIAQILKVDINTRTTIKDPNESFNNYIKGEKELNELVEVNQDAEEEIKAMVNKTSRYIKLTIYTAMSFFISIIAISTVWTGVSPFDITTVLAGIVFLTVAVLITLKTIKEFKGK